MRVGQHLCFLQRKELARIAFSGNTSPSKDLPSPSRILSAGFLAAGLLFRAEEGGPGQPASRAYVLIRVKISQAEPARELRGSSQLYRKHTWGILRSSQLTEPYFSYVKWVWASGSLRSFWAGYLNKSTLKFSKRPRSMSYKLELIYVNFDYQVTHWVLIIELIIITYICAKPKIIFFALLKNIPPKTKQVKMHFT